MPPRLPRLPLSNLHPKPPSFSPTTKFHIRFTSSVPPPSASSSPSTLRIQKILSRLPKSLQPYLRPLLNAPISHITTFLLLHELTAILPLLILSTYFHYSGVLPKSLLDSDVVEKGTQRFERYFARKGWFGLGEKGGEEEGTRRDGTRIVLEVACAYAVTKLLLPLRLLLSVWATPAVARVGLRAMGSFRPAAARARSRASDVTKLPPPPTSVSIGNSPNPTTLSNRSSDARRQYSTSNHGPKSPSDKDFETNPFKQKVEKAPPGENAKVFGLVMAGLLASGGLFGVMRLFARTPAEKRMDGQGNLVEKKG